MNNERKESNRQKKDKFRKTKEWKSFRTEMKEQSNNKDALTNKPLRAGWNLHHLDLRPEHYSDISDAYHFICLNRQSHEFVHWLYRYYAKDPDIIDRIIDAMNRMKSLNEQ